MFQKKMKSKFGTIRDPLGDPTVKVCSVALDDLRVSSAGSEDRVRQVSQVLDKAVPGGADFSVDKSCWAAPEVEYWGFLLSSEGRRPMAFKIHG